MSFDQKRLIEIIGATSIVASLVFVGMQLNIDTEVALSDQYATRTESIKSDIRARLESEDFMSYQEVAWENGQRPPWWNDNYENRVTTSGASPRQVYANIYNLQLGLFHVDNLYYQYQRGLLDEEFWARSRATVKDVMQVDFNRDVYLNSAFRLPIQELLTAIASEIANEQQSSQAGT